MTSTRKPDANNLLLAVPLAIAAGWAGAAPSGARTQGSLLKAIVLNMGADSATVTNAQGAPVGLTSNASARPLLLEAVAKAGARLASVAVSADGKDVPASKKWVKQAVHAQLAKAIDRARSSGRVDKFRGVARLPNLPAVPDARRRQQ